MEKKESFRLCCQKFPVLGPVKSEWICLKKEILNQLSRIKFYLKQRGEHFKEIDGIRISRGAGWALFRSSQTQEVLMMRFEAPTKKELFQLKKEFSEVMGFQIP